MLKTYETELAGRKLVFETGKMAGLANGSVLVRYGDTVVLVNVVASKEPKEGIDFFPLSVDFEEKLYSVGKIPGGFTKREGKPGDKAILTSRAIDRPLRPLFPKDFRNDVCVVATVMSVEQDNSPEVAAMIGASAALSISDIPFGGPTAAVNVGLVDGRIIINPTVEEREKSDLTLTVAGTVDKIAMIEAGANEVPDDVMLEAIKTAHVEIKKMCEFIQKMKDEIGKTKFEYKSFAVNEELFAEVDEQFASRMKTDVQDKDKTVIDARMDKLAEDVKAYLAEKHGEEFVVENGQAISEVLYKLEKKTVRKLILDEGKRVDGRGIYDIRPLSCEVGLIPRVHGSALFTRGETQVLSVTTLGAMGDQQILDNLNPDEELKRFMHHYNFPPFSVGEVGRMGNPGRREIGHGALGERALAQVIPSEKDFPYTIRVVSEVLESNGSSSQASICASTMSLMAAGVPIKAPVAGIAMGLITNGNIEDNAPYTILTDIQGMEDHLGDMDFKVAGTSEGICALQMDIKIKGINREILSKALAQAKIGRMQILENMMGAISEVREDVSKYAPKIAQMQISVDKIRDVIGAGGKVINEIIEKCDNVKIDIEQDGSIVIYHQDRAAINKAVEMIEALTKEAKVGEIYNAKVVRIESYGAFVELFEGTDALLHVSKIAHERVNHPKDVLKLDQRIKVLVTEIDEKGRVNVSAKDLLPKPVKTEEKKEEKK